MPDQPKPRKRAPVKQVRVLPPSGIARTRVSLGGVEDADQAPRGKLVPMPKRKRPD